ncbi:MAG: helix-turn-helix transcriptional regulator [Fibrobacteres bacterium]|nr:helix-turn-helix transcriptional regulator [Fibrobacterota bacterium]
MRFKFNTYNFSFILSGGGEYHLNGVVYPVKAPCVLVQAPDLLQEYGPAGECNEWEELFLIYNKDKIPVLKRCGFVRPDKPVWAIKESGPTRAYLQDLRKLAADATENGFADRVDRLCEQMILESMLAETEKNMTPEEIAVQRIRDVLTQNFREPAKFSALAQSHGLSDSTFRRYWFKAFADTPAQYVIRLKIEEACRLLVETKMKVSEIAHVSGFSDELYFYRRFKIETGFTALAYRNRHRYPLSFLK